MYQTNISYSQKIIIDITNSTTLITIPKSIILYPGYHYSNSKETNPLRDNLHVSQLVFNDIITSNQLVKTFTLDLQYYNGGNDKGRNYTLKVLNVKKPNHSIPAMIPLIIENRCKRFDFVSDSIVLGAKIRINDLDVFDHLINDGLICTMELYFSHQIL